MTAWHDQPPVSRRQVRQSQRDEDVTSLSSPEQNAPEDTSFAGIARQGWEAEARRASSPQGPPESRANSAVARGRRVQQPASNERVSETESEAETESLARVTQSRPQVPSYDGASFRDRAISAVPQPITAQAIEAESPTPAPSADTSRPEPVLTRRQMRELGIGGFVTSPSENDEAERAAAASAPAQPASAPAEVAAPVDVDPVEEAPAEEAPVEAAPVSEAPVEDAPVEEAAVEEAVAIGRPRFRDRARRATVDPELEREEARRAQELTGSAQTSDSAPKLAAEPPALVEPPVRQLFTGAIPVKNLGTPIAAVSPPIVSAPIESAPVESSPIQFVSTPVFSIDPAGEPEVIIAELESSSTKESAFEDLLFPSGEALETTIEPKRADAMPTTFDAFRGAPDAPTPDVADAATAVASADGTYVPPIGHWSTQALIDDDEQVQENTFARDVGATSGAITTSALVLPSMPTGEDIMGPLSGTGEILITGSINLPSSMGSTGVHPARYDHSDVDALLEADDREDSDPESAPVRAIRAVSTNTASGDVINSMKPRKASRLPIILIVSAAVMAVGVVVLLVAGLIFKIF